MLHKKLLFGFKSVKCHVCNMFGVQIRLKSSSVKELQLPDTVKVTEQKVEYQNTVHK